MAAKAISRLLFKPVVAGKFETHDKYIMNDGRRAAFHFKAFDTQRRKRCPGNYLKKQATTSKMIHVHFMPSLCVFIVVWTVQVHALGLHTLQERSQTLCTFLRGAVKLNVRVSPGKKTRGGGGAPLATFPERPFSPGTAIMCNKSIWSIRDGASWIFSKDTNEIFMKRKFQRRSQPNKA